MLEMNVAKCHYTLSPDITGTELLWRYECNHNLISDFHKLKGMYQATEYGILYFLFFLSLPFQMNHNATETDWHLTLVCSIRPSDQGHGFCPQDKPKSLLVLHVKCSSQKGSTQTGLLIASIMWPGVISWWMS